MEGTFVGGYRVLREIGAGGMGVVWLAEHIKLGRKAAIKILHSNLTTRPDIVTRFFNEARAATSISDPGIVQVFDFGNADDGSAYIVMELLEGEPLDVRLKREGSLPIGDALRIIRQVAGSVGAAHAKGIVHRDLKPDNVYLVRDPEVVGGERTKVLDFGIAKLSADSTAAITNTSMIMGTPIYMSPEQCRGAGRVDCRSDVYSLGCLLFKLISGRAPFQAKASGDLIVQHITVPAPRLSTAARGVTREIDDLVLRCMAKDPAKRYANGTELAVAIDEVSSELSNATAKRVSPTVAESSESGTTLSSSVFVTDPVRTVSRRSRMYVGAAAGAAVLGGVIAWVALRGPAEHAIGETPVKREPAAKPEPVAKPESPKPEPPKPEPPKPEPVAKPEPPKPEQVVAKPEPVAKPAPIVAKPEIKPPPKKVDPKLVRKPVPARPTPPVVAKPVEPKPPAKPGMVDLDGDGIPDSR